MRSFRFFALGKNCPHILKAQRKIYKKKTALSRGKSKSFLAA